MGLSKREMNRLEKELSFVIPHVGHTIQYYANLSDQNFGILERANIQENISAVAIWLKIPDSPFPIKTFSTQIRDCSCLKKDVS